MRNEIYTNVVYAIYITYIILCLCQSVTANHFMLLVVNGIFEILMNSTSRVNLVSCYIIYLLASSLITIF